jgi:rare lipoprotein A
MRHFLISAVICHLALSVANAQPAPTLPVILPALVDTSEVKAKPGKPEIHLEVLGAVETVVVFPLVALQLLSTALIEGATSETGIASVYAGGTTASGEKTRAGDTTAAHRSIPFGSRVRVTNRANGKTVVVRINDRGPFVRGRIIDLMPSSAKALGFSGLTRVTIVVVGGAIRKE